MTSKLLVIGSNSFTAAHFIHHVLENSDCRIIGISRSPEYDPIFLPYLYCKQERPSRFAFFQLDVNRDTDKVLALCDEFAPDAVVNFAAQGEVRNSWRWPEQWYQTNCMAVVRLSEHLRKIDRLQKYVAISTPEVYGTTGKDVSENHTYRPSTPYAASKLAGDLHLLAMHRRYHFPVTFTRAANVFGIHQQLYRIIPRTIIYLKLGKKIQLHGQGKTLRSFIPIKEVSDATFKVLIEGKTGEVYHIAPEGLPITVASAVNTICNIMGYQFEECVELIDEDYGQDEVLSMNSSKIRNELGWKSTISFESGVRETIQWVEDNWVFIQKQPLEYIHKE